MTTDITVAVAPREPALLGQTVVVIGGSAGIGLETARQARAEGAEVILTARNPDRLQQAAAELGARSTAAFDATDPDALDRFFAGLPEMIELPVAHGEGKLVLRSPRILEDLKKNKSIAMQYVDDGGKLAPYPYNPNGSVFNIAALSNPEGNCLGLMPHPERFTTVQHHPNWTRQTFMKNGVGLEMFRNAVQYCLS